MVQCLTQSLVVADAIEVKFLKVTYCVVDISNFEKVPLDGSNSESLYMLKEDSDGVFRCESLTEAIEKAVGSSDYSYLNECVTCKASAKGYLFGNCVFNLRRLAENKRCKGVFVKVVPCKSIEECNAIDVIFQKPYANCLSTLVLDLSSEEVQEVFSTIRQKGMISIPELEKSPRNKTLSVGGYNIIERTNDCSGLLFSGSHLSLSVKRTIKLSKNTGK